MVKQIKVLQTLVLFACCSSIDIKVFQTFTPRSAYRRERACPAPCVLLLDHITSVGQALASLPRFTAHPLAIPNYRDGRDTPPFEPPGGFGGFFPYPMPAGICLFSKAGDIAYNPPWGDLHNRNGVMKHPHLNLSNYRIPYLQIDVKKN